MISDRGPFELIRLDSIKNPFYVMHPSFPIGRKIYVQVPQNIGYIEAVVVGRLSSTSNAMIGISPRIYEIIKASDLNGVLTIYYEPK